MEPRARWGEDLRGFRHTRARCFVIGFFFFLTHGICLKNENLFLRIYPLIFGSLQILFFLLASKQIFIYFFSPWFLISKLVTSLKPKECTGRSMRELRGQGGRTESGFFFFLHPDGNLFSCRRLMDELCILSTVFAVRSGNAVVRRRPACRRTESSKQMQCAFTQGLLLVANNNHRVHSWNLTLWRPAINREFIATCAFPFLVPAEKAAGLPRRWGLFTNSRLTISS